MAEKLTVSEIKSIVFGHAERVWTDLQVISAAFYELMVTMGQEVPPPYIVANLPEGVSYQQLLGDVDWYASNVTFEDPNEKRKKSDEAITLAQYLKTLGLVSSLEDTKHKENL